MPIFCIAEYWGTQNMYSSEHVFFDLYIYIYARGCTFFGDIVSFVRTWMRFMMCSMLMLHMDASSLGGWARGCPFFDIIGCMYD